MGFASIKKLKEILPALVEIAPFKIPVKYSLNNSYKENPYKLSNLIFFKKFEILLIIEKIKLVLSNLIYLY